MAETVKLDQDRREAVRGTIKDTMVKVSKTSAPDVYITAITPDDTTILHLGDSTVIAKRSHVRLHVFCRQIGDVKFSGEAELTELPDLPADPKPKPKAKARRRKTIPMLDGRVPARISVARQWIGGTPTIRSRDGKCHEGKYGPSHPQAP